MKISEFRKLIREEVRKVIKEAGTPQENAIKIAVQTALDAGNDDKLYNDSTVSYKKLSKKAGLTVEELEHIVMYCLDRAGEDVPGMDNLDAKTSSGMTGYKMIANVKKKLRGMNINIDSFVDSTTNKQSSTGSIKVGSVVDSFIDTGMGQLKVVQIYPNLQAVKAAIAKLPTTQARKALRWYEDSNNKYDPGPFAQVVPAKGVDTDKYPKIIATTVLK